MGRELSYYNQRKITMEHQVEVLNIFSQESIQTLVENGE